jgi:aryl-alcohol dehydrogenase-like predicted oxidoreductase
MQIICLHDYFVAYLPKKLKSFPDFYFQLEIFRNYKCTFSHDKRALYYALELGCNLIDTASGYTHGESEKLIGKVLEDMPGKKAFVVSKAGYISHENLSVLEKLHAKGRALSDLVSINEYFKHSIHPDYLEAQLNVSLKRLKRPYIDGFLLHSPEYYFSQSSYLCSAAEYYSRIRLAFEFLEEKVKAGIIRYYGISSNTLIVNPTAASYTDIRVLVDIAKSVSTSHHFKLLQFPCNIVEHNAYTEIIEDGKSLLDIAKENHIVTFSNRPFNANDAGGLFRLALYDEVSPDDV